jgi:uncharacterized protein (DUF736 family)
MARLFYASRRNFPLNAFAFNSSREQICFCDAKRSASQFSSHRKAAVVFHLKPKIYEEQKMAILANMKKTDKGFEGKIKTACLDAYLKLQKIEGERTSDQQPDYKAKFGSFEAGAGWSRTSDNDNAYISVQIDSPEFPAPINANLIEKDGQHLLIWSRDK